LEKGQSQVDTSSNPKAPATKKKVANSVAGDDDDDEGLSDEAEFDDGSSSDGDSDDFVNDESTAGNGGEGAMVESEEEAEGAAEVDWAVDDQVEVRICVL